MLIWLHMEKEGLDDTVRLLRAIRSLSYNRSLQPLVERRIAQAEAIIRNRFVLEGAMEVRVGPYEVKMGESDEIRLTRVPVDGWRQAPLSIREESHKTCDKEGSADERSADICHDYS